MSAPADSVEPADPWADVVWQPQAVAQLQAAVGTPVHAYLLVGPHGSGKRQIAISFAAALLSKDLPSEIDAERAVSLALAERHPDLKVVERSGPRITVGQADEIVVEASRSPIESPRKVLVLDEFHLVEEAGPKLLKTIEEPPAGVFFLVLADEVAPELVTIASRCVRIDVGPVTTAAIVERLMSEGVSNEAAEEAADAASGDLRRARLLATDPQVATRHAWWRETPGFLDGSGSRAVSRANELLSLIDAAAEPLRDRQAEESRMVEERIEAYGERGSGRRQLEEQHRRELRRHKTDELRFGLAVLARQYREALVADPLPRYASAVDRIEQMAQGLVRNPNERLQLQALLFALPPVQSAIERSYVS